MRKEIREYIDNFVNSLEMEGVKINIENLNENIKLYEEKGEEKYRKEYPRSNYNLKELKYFRSELRKRKRILEQEKKEFIEKLKKAELAFKGV